MKLTSCIISSLKFHTKKETIMIDGACRRGEGEGAQTVELIFYM
jgi:hypothetical protein